MTIPILFLSDSPDLPGGLSRICRDLATNVSKLHEFRVGTLGRGGHYTCRLPFPQYNYPGYLQWGEHIIERCWRDFAGSEQGIIMTIWDASRLNWFARPGPGGVAGMSLPQGLVEFLTSGLFQRWGYFPVDAHSPTGKLSSLSADTLVGYDRVLAYTSWGSQVLAKSLGRDVDSGVTYIPHGYNPTVFNPKERNISRAHLNIDKDDFLVGVVMTNQTRKDWGLAFAMAAELKTRIPHFKLWCHVDVAERHWSIPALAADFGMGSELIVSYYAEDLQLALNYSACDVVVLPSLGEGFGYPLVEGLACGTPVVHHTYGGGAELIDEHVGRKVKPVAWRLDTLHNCIRPVFEPSDWADAVVELSEDMPGVDECVESVRHLQWPLLWTPWKRWFLEGINQ